VSTNQIAKVEAEVEYDVESSSVIGQLNASEIDIQIATANKYKRDIREVKSELLDSATLDEETAASMFYRLPRGGKHLEGPSVRLAEAAASAYGNLRFGFRVVSVDATTITAQGYCYDLQKNIAAACEVRRRITDRNGKRFNEDMIAVTGNAAGAIAFRNAVFKVVPMSVVKPALDAAKEVSLGKNKTLTQRRQEMLDWWHKKGASQDQVFAALGITGIDDLGNDELLTLRGLATAVKEGQISFETAMQPYDATTSDGAPASRIAFSATNERLRAAKQQTADVRAE
jgi:hypothetical protein